jgi:hypothetical protein
VWAASALEDEDMRVPQSTVDALLVKYHIHPPVTDERYLRHADIARGVALHVVCLRDRVLGDRIIVSSGRARWTRACPLSPENAKALAAEIADERALPHASQELETLVHLLLRCSRLFADEGLARLRLAPVYVRRNDYHIGSAAMASTSHIAAHKRLEPHAHDRDAVFAHRRTTTATGLRK